MLSIAIDIAEIAQIIKSQEPKTTYEALKAFFESKNIYLGKKEVADRVAQTREGIFCGADIIKEWCYQDAQGEERTLSFTDGAMIWMQSNHGHDWFVHIDDTKFAADSAKKKMYKPKGILSIKEGAVAYKDNPEKYVLHLFNNKKVDIVKNRDRLLAEIKKITQFDPHTKQAFLTHNPAQLGFVMLNYGDDFLKIIEEKKYSFQQRLEIAILFAQSLKTLIESGWTHGDIKPANVCYNGEKVRLIDFDSVNKIEDFLPQVPIYPKAYLAHYLSGPDKELLKYGVYRILQDLWAFILTQMKLFFQEKKKVEPFLRKCIGSLNSAFDQLHHHTAEFCDEELILTIQSYALHFIASCAEEWQRHLQALETSKTITWLEQQSIEEETAGIEAHAHTECGVNRQQQAPGFLTPTTPRTPIFLHAENNRPVSPPRKRKATAEFFGAIKKQRQVEEEDISALYHIGPFSHLCL